MIRGYADAKRSDPVLGFSDKERQDPDRFPGEGHEIKRNFIRGESDHADPSREGENGIVKVECPLPRGKGMSIEDDRQALSMDLPSEARGTLKREGHTIRKGSGEFEMGRKLDHGDRNSQGKVLPSCAADMEPEGQGKDQRQNLEWQVLFQGTPDEVPPDHG